MKLIIYDRSDLAGRVRPHRPMLRIYKEYCTIYPELYDLLEVVAGDGIKFAEDANKPGDWYIAKDNNDGIPTRTDKKTKSLRVILRAFTKNVPEHWYRQDIMVGTEPVEIDGIKWYPMITAALNTLPSIEQSILNKKTSKEELFNARDQY